MTENLHGAWRWVLVAVVLAVLGLLLATGLGRKRGTRLYRWRMLLWGIALAMMGGSVGLASPATKGAKARSKHRQLSTSAAGIDSFQAAPDPPKPEPRVTCYQEVAIEPEVEPKPPDPPVTCYKPMPPDPPVTCYEPMPVPPDDIEMPTCYEPMPDPPDPVPTCYAPPPDPIPTCYSQPPDPPPTCYAPPPDPPPTCYAPPPPDDEAEQPVPPPEPEDMILCYKPAPPPTWEGDEF